MICDGRPLLVGRRREDAEVGRAVGVCVHRRIRDDQRRSRHDQRTRADVRHLRPLSILLTRGSTLRWRMVRRRRVYGPSCRSCDRRPLDAHAVPKTYSCWSSAELTTDHNGPRRRDLGMPDVVAGLELSREGRDASPSVKLASAASAGRATHEHADDEPANAGTSLRRPSVPPAPPDQCAGRRTDLRHARRLCRVRACSGRF